MQSNERIVSAVERLFARGDCLVTDRTGAVQRLPSPRLAVSDEGRLLQFDAAHLEQSGFVVPTSDLAAVQRVPCHEDVRQVVFWDALPSNIREVLEPTVEALGEAGEELVREALLASPNGVDDHLRNLAKSLSDRDRETVCASIELAMREPSELLLGWLLVAGLVATDAAVLELGDLLVACREGDPARRAAFALEALRLCGTTEAHMQIQRVAFQASEPSVIAWAHQTLLSVAHDKGVPVWEVEDELVPSCGLERGAPTILPLGSLQLELALDEHLRPCLTDPVSRQRYDDLPADAEGYARWRVLREQLDEAIPVQVHRLEQALVLEVRWPVHQWKARVLQHPLMSHLVSRCIFGRYSATGRKLLETFRVERDHTLWGPDDEPYDLPSTDGTVGIVHPIDLDEETTHAWGAILADYEVVTCFPQLDRPVYRHLPDHARESEVPLSMQMAGCNVDPIAHLHRRGWRDITRWHERIGKTFRFRNVRVLADVLIDDGQLQEVVALSFERYLGYPRTRFHLRDVPPVVFSEARYEFEALRHASETGAFAAVGSA